MENSIYTQQINFNGQFTIYTDLLFLNITTLLFTLNFFSEYNPLSLLESPKILKLSFEHKKKKKLVTNNCK